MEVIRGADAGKRYALADGTVLLGNSLRGESGIDLASQEVNSPRKMAARQAQIHVANGTLSLRDLGSPGGTFVDRRRVPPGSDLPLKEGDVTITAPWPKDLTVAAYAVGFDPFIGFMHQPRFGRPALALDLMEPFRPLIADQTVLAGMNKGQIDPGHFHTEGNAVLLNDEGRKLVLELLETRYLTSVTIEGRADPVTWRQAIGISARNLAEALKTCAPFQPIERV